MASSNAIQTIHSSGSSDDDEYGEIDEEVFVSLSPKASRDAERRDVDIWDQGTGVMNYAEGMMKYNPIVKDLHIVTGDEYGTSFFHFNVAPHHHIEAGVCSGKKTEHNTTVRY